MSAANASAIGLLVNLSGSETNGLRSAVVETGIEYFERMKQEVIASYALFRENELTVSISSRDMTFIDGTFVMSMLFNIPTIRRKIIHSTIQKELVIPNHRKQCH